MSDRDARGEVGSPLDGQFISLLGLLLDGSSALVGIKDRDFRYVFANRALEQAVGIPPGGMIGRRDAEFMAAEAAHGVEARERDAIAGGIPIQTEEDLVFSSGRVVCVSVRFPYRDPDGIALGSGFVAIDIGERRAMESRTRDALLRAERVIEELRGAIVELEARASTDRLTGLWNRARIEESARHEISRMERYGYPLSLLFIDLDHFKRINDTHGHSAGDDVLRQFAEVARQAMRGTDLLGRWGGEEFLMLCTHTNLAAARILAQRLRQGVSAYRFPGVGQVTASIGVAQCQEGESLEHWVARCDRALYRAKSSGRDQVVVDIHPGAATAPRSRPDLGFVRLVWRDQYACGHRTIDAQHRQLVELANDLIGNLSDGNDQAEVVANLALLVSAVKQHFADEEEVLRRSGFPGLDHHSASHAGLLENAGRLFGALADGEANLAQILQFLAHDLIATHLLGEDRKFFAHVQALPD
jgi:diguanylate cyclase (GGDEF)-like protein/hemerythrin-like metal-binding protein/PAS domain S-box-containing protein